MESLLAVSEFGVIPNSEWNRGGTVKSWWWWWWLGWWRWWTGSPWWWWWWTVGPWWWGWSSSGWGWSSGGGWLGVVVSLGRGQQALGIDIGIGGVWVLGRPWWLCWPWGWGWLGLFFWVNGFTFISDLSIVSILPVSGVLDNLGTAVGKEGTVLSLDNITVALGIVREVIANIILHGISEVERHSWLMFTVWVKTLGSDLFLLVILGWKVSVLWGSGLGVVVPGVLGADGSHQQEQ
jgi:hypothetical protein